MIGDNGNGIEIKTPLGPLVARGATAMLAIIVALVGTYAYFEMDNRSQEHQRIISEQSKEHKEIVYELRINRCLNRLTIYQNTLALKGENIDFSRLPPDLWECTPRWLVEEYERQKRNIR